MGYVGMQFSFRKPNKPKLTLLSDMLYMHDIQKTEIAVISDFNKKERKINQCIKVSGISRVLFFGSRRRDLLDG